MRFQVRKPCARFAQAQNFCEQEALKVSKYPPCAQKKTLGGSRRAMVCCKFCPNCLGGIAPPPRNLKDVKFLCGGPFYFFRGRLRRQKYPIFIKKYFKIAQRFVFFPKLPILKSLFGRIFCFFAAAFGSKDFCQKVL